MIKLMINGATGKMGVVSCDFFDKQNNITIVARLSSQDNLEKALEETKPDVVIDVTTPDVIFENAKKMIEHDARPVIVTSGLTKEHVRSLVKACDKKQLGGIILPNASLSAVILMKMAEEAAKYFGSAEIVEMHHEQKKDAPSGTAVATAEKIAAVRNNFQYEGKELFKGACGADIDGVAVHSMRMPGLLAHQTVIFGGPGETLSLRYDTINRDCYMKGLLLSCQRVMTANKMIVGLENIL